MCLVVPAFCLAEPHETLTRRHKRRSATKADLDRELQQLARTATNTAQLSEFDSITDLLVRSAEQESRNLNRISAKLLSVAELIPLDESVLADAAQYQNLSPQDSIVYGSVVSHLRGCHQRKSYFISRDSDFDDQYVVNELSRFNCEVVDNFGRGCQFITRDLGLQAASS